MKTCHLALPVLAWCHDETTMLATSQDDTPTLLSLKMKVHSTISSGVDHFLDVVGSRNVTQMSSLLQNLVEETIEGSDYELDGEVQAALEMIKDALLGDIRGALKEAHCLDQKDLHKGILCFEGCEDMKEQGTSTCGSHCDGSAHKKCRDDLLTKYVDHVTDCRELDVFVRDFSKNNCPKFEKKCCLLSHTTWNCGGVCADKIAHMDVDSSYGSWINTQINMFERAHEQWTELHLACTSAYHAYVEKDAECDCLQAECETRNCEWETCHYLSCDDVYNKCWGRCEAEYTRTNEAKECLEKDRKIDWSATEKIECYVNVLLEKPSNETLLATCGATDCFNKYREQMYQECNDVCVEVDFETVSGARSDHARHEHKEGHYNTKLAPYPGYSGELSVGGTVGAHLSNDEAIIWFHIEGVEADCAAVPEGVANACGIHIHEGKTCDDAGSVGGHYYDKDSVSEDPWVPVTYHASAEGKAKGKTSVRIGAGQNINGRAIVVHDKTGARIACALIEDNVKDQTTHQHADIDVTGEGVNSVHTRHRGKGENRCTSHLDLDYQLPPCCKPCEARPSPPCEGRDGFDGSSYMWLHYGQYGHFSTDAIGDAPDQICHVGEHTKAYAYNLCDCVDCPKMEAVPPPTCTHAKACAEYESYDYRQHDITNDCEGAPPPMELPESNCPIPEQSKACHFWGDPHFSHLFFSNLKVSDSKKGGRHHGRHLAEFRPFGVFNLAENEDKSFEAQAFFCPWRNSGAPGVGAGLAMRFGDDIIQVVRGPTDQLHHGGWNKDVTQFFVNGKQVPWNELGNATGMRGRQVPGTGGLTTAFMFMQQEKTTNQDPYLPVCVGNDQDTLVEVGVQSMYYQDVTIRTNQPGTSGICSVPDGKMSNDAKVHEQYRVDTRHNLFSTRQMKHLCDVCNLETHQGRSGPTCSAPGHDVSPEEVCKNVGADYEEVKKKCGDVFDGDDDWLPVCIMETCASGEGAVAISRIEEHLQSLMIDEE